MTDETDATQGAPEGDAAAIPAHEASATGTENEAPAEASTEAERDDKPKPKPWFQRRIDELTRARYEAERKVEAMAETVRALRETVAQPEGEDGEKLTKAQVEARAAQLAERMAAEKAFTDECNRIYEAGVKAFNDFDEVIGNFRMLGGLTPAVIEAAAATDMPEKVLYELGNDPEKAERLIKLPPSRLGVELAKIATKLSAPKPSVSKAPAPIKPVDGPGKGEVDPDKMSDREWMEWRNKQVAAKRA